MPASSPSRPAGAPAVRGLELQVEAGAPGISTGRSTEEPNLKVILPVLETAYPSGIPGAVQHRVFCHITLNWRGKPLRTFETIVDWMGNTRTNAGLRVKAELDKRKYPTGVVKTDAEMDALSLHRNEFPGGWNHGLRPR